MNFSLTDLICRYVYYCMYRKENFSFFKLSIIISTVLQSRNLGKLQKWNTFRSLFRANIKVTQKTVLSF